MQWRENASEDFLQTLLNSYITSAAMEMETLDDCPSSIPEDLWTEDRGTREGIMDIILSLQMNKLKYNSLAQVSQDRVSTYA